jgi:hypothetical protein
MIDVREAASSRGSLVIGSSRVSICSGGTLNKALGKPVGMSKEIDTLL